MGIVGVELSLKMNPVLLLRLGIHKARLPGLKNSWTNIGTSFNRENVLF